jgi:ferric iron reductase protein FhuF
MIAIDGNGNDTKKMTKKVLISLFRIHYILISVPVIIMLSIVHLLYDAAR